MSSIYDFVKEQRDSYRTDTVDITDGYEFSQYETLRTIELYHNSRFTAGNTDSLGREKPFFNITKFRVNVATRATDLDTKDVKIESERGAYALSFLLTLKNRNWMKDFGFPFFLNKMGHTRAKYGGVLVKKTEHDGELELHVMRWRDLITDQVHILSGPIIERHYYTPAELKEKAGVWRNIDEAIEAAEKSKEANAADDNSKENKTPGAYIEVFEVHGVLPKSYLDEDEAADEYERQMHIIVLDESKTEDGKDKVEGVTLFNGKEKECPYKYLPWEEVDGRGLGVGVVEDLFEAQVWTNYNVKQKKDMLDLAGKIIFQTSDQSIAAKNILTDIEQGQIITTAPNMPVTQVNNFPSSLPAFDKLIDEWNTQAERVSSTPPALTGETMPAGQPFRLAAMLNQEAGSMFVYRTEEAGLFIQEIYQDWVLPFLVKQIKKDKELIAELERDELEMVADALAKHEAFKFAKEQILSGNPVTPGDMQAVFDTVQASNLSSGTRRAFKLIEDMFKGWEGKVQVVTTGEQKNKAVVLETLFNIFQVVAKNPQVLQDPVMRRLFNQIVESAGFSPLMLEGAQSQAPPAEQLPDRISPEKVAA